MGKCIATLPTYMHTFRCVLESNHKGPHQTNHVLYWGVRCHAVSIDTQERCTLINDHDGSHKFHGDADDRSETLRRWQLWHNED